MSNMKPSRAINLIHVSVVLAIIAVTTLPAKVGSASQPPDELFISASPQRIEALPDEARRESEVVIRRRYATVNFDFFSSQVLAAESKDRAARKVSLALFEDVRVELDTTNVKRQDDGIYTWESNVEAEFFGRAALALTENNARGLIQIDARIYEIAPADKDLVSISEIDQSKFPRSDSPDLLPNSQPFPGPARTGIRQPAASGSESTGAADAPINVSVLVVFPQPASNFICQNPDYLALTVRGFEQNLNAIYSTFPTGVQATVEGVCVNYAPQGGDLNADLNWLSNSSLIATIRNKHRSDLVSLLVPTGDDCGRGNRPSLPVTSANADQAFSVVKADCALSNYSLAHELGHNFGMRHDRITDQQLLSTDCNFGFVALNNSFRTIMSYASACNNCPRIGFFSTPQSMPPFGAGTFGVDCSAPRIWTLNGYVYLRANNLQQLITAAPVVSAYR